MKKYIIPLSIVAATFAASCSSDENLPQEIDNSMKTPIEFSMTDQTGSATIGAESYRAQTRAGFSAQTRIVMRMMAEKITLGSSSEATASETKYTKTEAVAETNNGNQYSDVTFTNSESVINTRYWDDAYGRDTKLSVFAIAVPGKKSTDNIQLSLTGDNTWSTAHTDNTISWSVSNNQSSTTIGNEDLVYSNNIQKYNSQTGLGQNGVREWDFNSSKYKELTFDATGNPTGLSNDRMKFQMKPVSEGQNQDPKGPGKFDTGNLNFTHALSRITLKIKLASEFGNNALLDDNEVKVLNMPYKGTLNVATGNFSSIENKDEIIMAPISTTEENIKGQYMAQVLPGYNIAADRTTNADNNMLQFKVVTKDASNNITSQNIYYVTNKSVNTALANNANISGDIDSDGNITMSQGKHYILTITVGKTAIKDITATLVDWTTVTGEHTQDNAYLTFTNSFKNSYKGNPSAADNFDLYRLNDPSTDVSTDGNYKSYAWKSKWTDKAELTKDNSYQETGKSKWTTKWFFDDNKSFYHFRMVGQKADGEDKTRTIHEDATNGDYFDIESGTTDGNYTWGAPFVSGSDLKYNTASGYDNESDGTHNIHYAIGATNDNIHLTSFHMLSQIRVVLKTVDALQGGVNLQSGEKKTTVKITNVFTKGKVNMGNGLVKAGTYSTGTDSRISVKMTEPSPFFKGNNTSNLETNEFTYFIVPQTLVEGQTYVGLEITTPDNNIYYVVKKLSEITATSVGNNGTQEQGGKITWWYPNHSYLYTITLKKTGIEKITCTLVDWTEVTGSNQDVTIED